MRKITIEIVFELAIEDDQLEMLGNELDLDPQQTANYCAQYAIEWGTYDLEDEVARVVKQHLARKGIPSI